MVDVYKQLARLTEENKKVAAKVLAKHGATYVRGVIDSHCIDCTEWHSGGFCSHRLLPVTLSGELCYYYCKREDHESVDIEDSSMLVRA